MSSLVTDSSSQVSNELKALRTSSDTGRNAGTLGIKLCEIVSDPSYFAASSSWSISELSKDLGKIAACLDLAASVTAVVSGIIGCIHKLGQGIELLCLNRTDFTAWSKKGAAKCQFEAKQLSRDFHNGKYPLVLKTTAAFSYLTGAVSAIINTAPAWMAASFGSLGFGLLYAGACTFQLREHTIEHQTLLDEAILARGQINAAPSKKTAEANTSLRAAEPFNTQEKIEKLWKAKFASIERLQSDAILNAMQSSTDACIGVAATVAGVTSLTGVGALAGTTILVASLGVSLSLRVGTAVYRNLGRASSRKRARLGLTQTALRIRSLLPFKPNTFQHRQVEIGLQYNRARACELTGHKQEDLDNLVSSIVICDGEDTREVKTFIAKQCGLFNEEGTAAPSQVEIEHVHDWLISARTGIRD